MRSSVVSMEHFGEKVGRLHALREDLGRTGPFDIAIAPPFRPSVANDSNARRLGDEIAQMRQYGANWTWTSLPASTLEHYLELVQWYGEIAARCRADP